MNGNLQGSFLASVREATPQEAAQIFSEAGAGGAETVARGVAPAVEELRKPGQPPLSPGSPSERWTVKVGTDADSGKVTSTLVNTTVAKLGKLARPPGWVDNPKSNPPKQFVNARFAPAETTVWRVSARIIGFRLEADGDFHVELKTPDGTMNVEIPLPKPPFVPANSPFATDIRNARRAFIDAFKDTVAQKKFAPSPESAMLAPIETLVPPPAEPGAPQLQAAPAQDATTAALEAAARRIDLTQAFDSDEVNPFVMMVAPTPATVTGIGFFDKDHGQANNSPNIIELHPVLSMTFI
jgi:hypothetical protein